MARTFSGGELDNVLAQIEKGHQLAGHCPDDDAMDRARRILTGETTEDEAYAELHAKYGMPETGHTCANV